MRLQKVIWYEGMKLDPHHFQQADKYNQYYINSKLNYINQNNWGFRELQIDIAALSGGSFSLVRCSGIMPDNLLFDMPENDPLPKTRSFAELFPATSEKIPVYLTIQVEKPAGNTQMNESSNSHNPRFGYQTLDIPDYNTGTNIRTIRIVKPNFQFKFGDESLDDFSAVKIGEIVRNSEGKYDMNQSYIPPVLSISASESLKEYCRDLLGAMISKSKELRIQAGIQKPELSLTQIEILLMLHSVNVYIPLLNYYYSSPHIHPENLYILFLNIAGQLSTSSNLGIKNGDFPIYNHNHLTEIFHQMNVEINSMLHVQKTVSRRDVIVPLRKQADTLFVGQLAPNQMGAIFYIAVQGDMPEKKIITEFSKNIKISSYEEIFAVSQAGIQGVNVEYVARPQPGVAINERAHYFKVNKEGRFWDKIVTKNNIALFLATEFKVLHMELVLLMPE